MSSDANDHRGIVQRIREARRAYRGPFTGEHVQAVVLEAGYQRAYDDDPDSLAVYVKDGRKPVPVKPGVGRNLRRQPTFRCLQRDLEISRHELRTRLNRARNAG